MESTQSTFSAPTQDNDTGDAHFPAVRYFQVHFEHMETQLTDMHHRMDELQRQVTELQMRLVRKEKILPDPAYRQTQPGNEGSNEKFWHDD